MDRLLESFRRSAGWAGMAFLGAMFLACVCSLPWTLGGAEGTARFNAGEPKAGRLPPSWVSPDADAALRLNRLVERSWAEEVAARHGVSVDVAIETVDGVVGREMRRGWPEYPLGTDAIGRGLFVRLLTGGGISLTIGIAAAFISVSIGALYGSVAAYAGGVVDAVLMRIVDILFGLPYILLVVLLAVASDALLEELETRGRARQAWVADRVEELGTGPGWVSEAPDGQLEALGERLGVDVSAFGTGGEALRGLAAARYPSNEGLSRHRTLYDVVVLLIAIGGVSWLTMARVVRGQVLSLKEQQFMEAARAVGAPLRTQFVRHLLPNLMGPIIVYATLTVPQAILQESFLSFLGIGVKPPLPSWGNLAADGLNELNQYRSHWWLLLFPCLLLGSTLLALNFVGEALRERFDPKSRGRS